MKEYEVVCKYINGCAGEKYPLTTFDEVILADTDDYIKEKHGEHFCKFTKQIRPNGQVVYEYRQGVAYYYEFTPL